MYIYGSPHYTPAMRFETEECERYDIFGRRRQPVRRQYQWVCVAVFLRGRERSLLLMWRGACYLLFLCVCGMSVLSRAHELWPARASKCVLCLCRSGSGKARIVWGRMGGGVVGIPAFPGVSCIYDGAVAVESSRQASSPLIVDCEAFPLLSACSVLFPVMPVSFLYLSFICISVSVSVGSHPSPPYAPEAEAVRPLFRRAQRLVIDLQVLAKCRCYVVYLPPPQDSRTRRSPIKSKAAAAARPHSSHFRPQHGADTPPLPLPLQKNVGGGGVISRIYKPRVGRA